MAGINLRLKSNGMRELLNSAGVRAMLTEHAQPVLEAAIADPHDDSGAYEASLHIEQATTDRAVVRVVADVPYALVLEANYGILNRALAGADGLVDYTRKDGVTIRVTAAQAANYGGRRS